MMLSRASSHLRGRLTYANAMATVAVAVALGGTSTAIAAVVITSNAQVARNTIAGHAAPSGSHANIISGSVNATDLATTYKTSVTVHCPSGMQLNAGLCFETVLRPATDFTTAVATCAQAQRRLPDVGELALVFSNSGAPQDWQWFGQPFFDGKGVDAAALSENSSRQISFQMSEAGASLAYRCVTVPTN